MSRHSEPHLRPDAPARTAAPAKKTRPRALKTKLFVLDTNVLMHDPTSLFRFEEHDVFLPMQTLEELDDHKKGISEVARNARQASRYLDEIVSHVAGKISGGIPLARHDADTATGKLLLQMEAMAADYLREIKTRQPVGPYNLCVYSFVLKEAHLQRQLERDKLCYWTGERHSDLICCLERAMEKENAEQNPTTLPHGPTHAFLQLLSA